MNKSTAATLSEADRDFMSVCAQAFVKVAQASVKVARVYFKMTRAFIEATRVFIRAVGAFLIAVRGFIQTTHALVHALKFNTIAHRHTILAYMLKRATTKWLYICIP